MSMYTRVKLVERGITVKVTFKLLFKYLEINVK